MSDTKGSREPSGRTTEIDTGACWPRDPLKVTYRLPSMSKTGLSTWCRPVASGAPTSTYAVSPGASSRRTGIRPPSRPSGTTTVIDRADADASRAGAPPIVTRGREDPAGNPSPSIVTRPPSTAQSGRTAEMRGLGCVMRIRWKGRQEQERRSGEPSGFVQLHVPVEVVAPAVRCVFQPHGEADRWRFFGTSGHPYQVHAGFSRRAPTFLAVATDAAGDDVLPVLAPA